MSQPSSLVLLRTGIAAAKAGNRSQAHEVLQRAIELDPQNELAWLWLASTADTLPEAKHCLQRILEINPANVQALKGLEIIKAKLAQIAPREQCPFCQATIEQKDKCPTCHAVLSLASIDQVLSNTAIDPATIQAAMTRYQTAIQKDDDDFGAHYHLGLAYLNVQQLEQGIYHLQKAQQLHFEDSDLKRQVDLLVQRQVVQNAPPLPTVRPKTVLVVDDSPTICKLVSITLEKNGYQVVRAADGLDGLSKLNDTHPDLILLDITMPRMDGYQLCRVIKGNPETQRIPVVMLSGKDGFFDKVRGRTAGATDYITKPFEPDTLLQTIQKYADQKPNDAKVLGVGEPAQAIRPAA